MATPLRALYADITTLNVDAIVNAANASLLPGGGVCGAIHRVAGTELAQECRSLSACRIGDAKLTKGYRLPARYVIHAVGPVWKGGSDSEPSQLASCYCRCLEIAAATGLRPSRFQVSAPVSMVIRSTSPLKWRSNRLVSLWRISARSMK